MWIPASQRVRADAAQPGRTVLMLHGILGSGRNLRGLALRVVQARPDCEVVLVDLRNHGDSHGAPPPHTLQACAADLIALCRDQGLAPACVVGHSYGGKVALELARQPWPGLRQVWVLDAVPHLRAGEDAGPAAVERVLAALRSLPQPIASRQAVAEALRVRGFDEGICQWMTTNVAAADGGYRWKFNLDAIGEMLDSYFATDSWPVLQAPKAGLELHLVRAGRSDRWTPEVLARLATLRDPHVHVHVLADAGHWVHVDAPEGVLALLLQGLAALWPAA